MKDCTKRWPTGMAYRFVELENAFQSWELESSAFTLRPVSPSHKQRVCCTLWQAEISWFWKLTKISETGDEPQPSKKHRHEVPPKININFLTDAGKTKGALGFVVLAFFANVFCWRGYSIHLLLPILSILTIDTPFSKEIGYTAGVWFVGALTSSGLCRSVFYFHQLSVGKYLNVPCWPSPKMSLRMAGDWATQN